MPAAGTTMPAFAKYSYIVYETAFFHQRKYYAEKDEGKENKK